MKIKLLPAGLILFVSVLAFNPHSAFAADLESAKKQGLVGETDSGYLAAVTNPPADVQQLMNQVNSERKQHYADIAKKNNTTVAAVEALAGKKAIEMTPSGEYVQSSGRWSKK